MKQLTLLHTLLVAMLPFAQPDSPNHHLPSSASADTERRASSQLGNSNAYESAYEQLRSLSLLRERVAHVTDYTIERDAARFTLDEGVLYLLTPVNGDTVAAVFSGEGTFEFHPPNRIERSQLDRFYETDALEVPFKDLFLFFTDSTLAALESDLRFENGDGDGSARRHLEESLKFLSNDDTKYFHPGIISEVLNSERRGLFYAHLSESRGDPLFFEVNPYFDEEVRLLRRAKINRSGGGVANRPRGPAELPAEVISQFDLVQGSAPYVAQPEASRDLISVDHYNMDLTIESNLDFSAETEIAVTSLTPQLSWVPFRLFDELEVTSVRGEDGAAAAYFRAEDATPLWIEFDPPIRLGEVRKVTVQYEGELILRLDNWYNLKSATNWYPRYGLGRSTFDMTVTSPERLRFVGAGENVSTHNAGNAVVSRWVTSGPYIHSSFNLGEFEEYQIDFPGIPHTTVLMAGEAHRSLPTRFIPGPNMINQVGADVANSLSFFRDAFGEPEADRFCATEILAYHGQAFPGMVHLSFATFHETSAEGADEVFRAHEMAHQWWGLGVGFDTYHDQWLDEALAEFSGLWYLESVLGQKEKMLALYKEYRDEIFDRGDEAGPPWLGQRLATSTTPDDYGTIVYHKGAWIIQMLRHLMSDMSTDGEERFVEMLRDYYATYRGKNASTDDFKQILEKHIGMQMDWFFEQWVYGNDLPRYELQYVVEPTANGRFLTRVRIGQLDVPDDFQMFVPLALEFENGSVVRVQMFLNGPFTEAELPPLGSAPVKITMIPAEEVLARVEELTWESDVDVYQRRLSSIDTTQPLVVNEAFREFEGRFGGRAFRPVVDSAMGVFESFRSGALAWWRSAVERVPQSQLAQIYDGVVSPDDTIALRLKHTLQNAGFTVDSSGGYFFLADSVGYLRSLMLPHVSEHMAQFLLLRQREREEIADTLTFLAASPAFLAERINTWDSLIVANPHNIFIPQANDWRQRYLRALVSGVAFEATNDGTLRGDFDAAYLQLARSPLQSELHKLFARYHQVLSDNDFKLSSAVRRFLERNGITWIAEPPNRL